MTERQSDALSDNSPDPATTPGLEPGGGVTPGDTPPAAGQMSGAPKDRERVPNQGPVSGNRTPMVVTLGLLGLVVLLVVIYGIGEIVAYVTKDPGSDTDRGLAPVTAPLLR